MDSWVHELPHLLLFMIFLWMYLCHFLLLILTQALSELSPLPSLVPLAPASQAVDSIVSVSDMADRLGSDVIVEPLVVPFTLSRLSSSSVSPFPSSSVPIFEPPARMFNHISNSEIPSTILLHAVLVVVPILNVTPAASIVVPSVAYSSAESST